MKQYVDGFLLPVPKDKIPAYSKVSEKARKVWLEHGALDYRECVGDDMEIEGMAQFPKTLKVKAGEVVVFAFITYKSRKHRDQVNAKVMKDPRMTCMDPKDMPFDCKRMNYGGFKTIVGT